MIDNDIIDFVDELPSPGTSGPTASDQSRPWRVLIVDDDLDVHEATRFALRGIVADGRGLSLLHAHSAAEGLAMLRCEADIAVALVDVVMETEDAGLRLVEQARQQLGLRNLRIVLRTGQPGTAPELDTIQRFDINDYRTKSELTRNRLHVSLLAALRSYDQLQRLDRSRAGLEKVIQASRSFIADSGMAAFAEGVILQLSSLMNIGVQGLVCVRAAGAGPAADPGIDYTVIAAVGPFSHLLNQRADQISEAAVAQGLRQCLEQRCNVLRTTDMALFFPGAQGRDTAAFVALPGPLDDTQRHLLDVFCANITVCADNIGLLERLRNSAYVDEQLGVANHVAMCQRIDELRRAGQAAERVLVLVDVDQFAEINDMLGIAAGDRLLKQLSARLARLIDADDLLARVGGNTFALLFKPGCVSEAALHEAVAQPVRAGGMEMPISASLGWLPGRLVDDVDGSIWLKKASIALKRAKARGLGQSETYSAALSLAAEQRTRMLQALQEAVDTGALSLAYQPKLDLRTGKVAGLEALMRWRSADGTMVPPDQFIPVAEQSGLIIRMGLWALQTALRALQQLHQAGHGGLQVAVNVTVSQFQQPDFVAQVMATLHDVGMRPADLELEVTESVALIGQHKVTAVLHELRAQGISLAIDDFGTGYSSLAYLDQIPANRLKIDRAFVQRLGHPGPGARIAGLIVPLGHLMGMKVVAEGVETPMQATLLHDLGCDEVQGFLYARPMPLAELLVWLRQPGAARPPLAPA